MRTKLACVVAGISILLAVAQVRTHHAFSAEFDIEKPLSLKGTLVRWDMINPHSWFHLDIEDDDGTVVTWLIEGGSPNELIRNGVTKNTLAIGTELTVEGYQAKDGDVQGGGPELHARQWRADVSRRVRQSRRGRSVVPGRCQEPALWCPPLPPGEGLRSGQSPLGTTGLTAATTSRTPSNARTASSRE